MFLTKDEVARLPVDKCRKRFAKMKRMAKAGDFTYSYDEYLWLEDRIPEEKQARKEVRRLSKR